MARPRSWYIWGGIEIVEVRVRGRNRRLPLIREYVYVGSERDARAIVETYGGGTMTLCGPRRPLKKIVVPARETKKTTRRVKKA